MYLFFSLSGEKRVIHIYYQQIRDLLVFDGLAEYTERYVAGKHGIFVILQILNFVLNFPVLIRFRNRLII